MGASPTARRAPAVRDRVRLVRRSSSAVASFTARRRAGYEQRTPKKMKAAALRSALSDRARGGKLHVVIEPRRRRRPVDQDRGCRAREDRDRAARPGRRRADRHR